MSSFPLTFIFFRGVGQAPNSFKMADFYLNLWSFFQKAKDDQPSNKNGISLGDFTREKNTKKTMGKFSHFFGGLVMGFFTGVWAKGEICFSGIFQKGIFCEQRLMPILWDGHVHYS